MDDALRIASVRHWLVRVPFSREIRWATGRRTHTTRLVARIETRGGIVGWGETISLIDAVPAVFANVVAPLAVGYDAADAERFHRHVHGLGYYHHKRAAVMAIAALEMAMWDAVGRHARLPLYRLWGGGWRRTVAVAGYLFDSDPARAADQAGRFLDAGYRTFKAKIGFDAATDRAVLAAVRARIGDLPLRADVNGAWTLAEAKRQGRALAELDLAYLEQPLEMDDLIGHRGLRTVLPMPIALDESAYTLADVSNIVRQEAADVILLDPHEAGGLWQTIKAAAIAEAAGIAVTLHSGGELALSQAAYLHLAASIPNLSLAIDTERVYLAADIAQAPPQLVEGTFAVPDAPGLGVEPDPAMLDPLAAPSITGAYEAPRHDAWFPTKPDFSKGR